MTYEMSDKGRLIICTFIDQQAFLVAHLFAELSFYRNGKQTASWQSTAD